MLNVPITLPRTIEDHDGFDWDVISPASILDGENDAFDSGFLWSQFNSTASAVLSENGREINVQATSLTGAAGVEGSRSIYVSGTLGYARFLDTFHNTTGSSITFTYTLATNLGSDGDTTVVATGSGDTTFGTNDTFLTTSDNGNGDTIVTHYIQDGHGALSLTSATLSNDNLNVSYSITLAAGETKSLLFFGFQNATTTDAAAQVADFQFSKYSYLEGLTLDERNRVQNFDVNGTHTFVTEGPAIRLFDADGFLWDLQSDGAVQGTTPYDAFDSGFDVTAVAGATTAAFAENGREVNYASFNPGVAGITGTRSVYVSDKLGFARFLDSFTNTTAAAITFTYSMTSDLGSDSATVVAATGSGDTTFTATDTFITTSDGTGFDPDPANGNDHDPFVTHYFNDRSGLTPTGATLYASGNITVTYSLTINPGETKSLLSFGFQNQDAAAATAQVLDFQIHKYEYLAGLTLDERNTVVNFDANSQHDFSGSSDGFFLLLDADNFRWGFDRDLGYARPANSTFNTLSFDIPTYNSSSSIATLTDGGREINVTGTLTDQAGLAVTRSTYVSDTLGYARFLDSFTNTSGSAITYTFALNSRFPSASADVHLIATGSGDTVYQLADTFVSADDSADGNSGVWDVGTIIFNDGTRAIPSAGDAATGSDRLDVQYTFTIKAGETLSFMAFAFQNANAADATNQVNDFFANHHQIDYYEGLSPEERARLMNFSGLGDTPTNGDNLIIGTPGNDNLSALDGHDRVFAGPGDDTVTNLQGVGDADKDFYDGGDGIDTLVYDLNWVNTVVFDFSAGEVRFGGVNDTFAHFENISVGGAAQVIGDGNANVIIGLSTTGSNNFNGGGGNDAITGGGGNDTIDGGTGVDSARFAGNRAAYTITDQTNGVKVSGSDGTDTITNVERLVFDNVTVSKGASDFSGDFQGDLLWRHNDGTTFAWLMNNGQRTTDIDLTKIPNTFHVQDTGDFNGDGNADILWRHDDGTTLAWLMVDGQRTSDIDYHQIPNTFHVRGTGDIDGDGDSDILWQHDDGTTLAWLMQNGQRVQDVSYGQIPTSFHIQGIGDFDGDGDSDILWRHNDGSTLAWLMQNGQRVQDVSYGQIPTSFHIQGIGDFDGDGDSDILWRHNDGTTLSWLMQNGQRVQDVDYHQIPNTFHVQTTADINGSGTADIIWRHDDGTTLAWLMVNGQRNSDVSLGAISNAWTIQQHHFDTV